METVPIGVFRASWLLLRLQSLRFGRQLLGGFRGFKKKPTTEKRKANAGKTKQGWLIGVFVSLSIMTAFTNMAHQAVSDIEETLGSVAVPYRAGAKSLSAPQQKVLNKAPQRSKTLAPLPPAPGFTLAPGVLKALVFETFLLFAAVTLLAVGSSELTLADWDLEWLTTLPVSLSTLLSARILSRSINPKTLCAFLPFLWVVAWESGYRVLSPLVALLAVFPMMVIAATVQTFCDTGLRLRLGPSQLRNLQAFIAIAALIAIYLALSPGMPPKGSSFLLNWAYVLPAWTFWLPPGLAIQVLTSATSQSAAWFILLLTIEAGLCAALGVALLKRQLRFGVVASGMRESGRPNRLKKSLKSNGQRLESRWLLTPVQARELRLLGRDRTFLVQTLVMPVVIVGARFFLNGSDSNLFASVHYHPEYLASLAFGVAAYALMFSAFQILNAEGQALWILYCVPQSLESILRQKAVLWGVAALIYPLTIFGFVIASQAPTLQLLELAGIVLIGVPIFAIIATSLGVFACDPLAQNVQRRVRPSYAYLYLLLSSTYIYSVYAESFWQRLALLILTVLLAVALSQKARDHLPYLLDPAASPPPQVSVSDGLIAALLFFVLQGVVMLIRLQLYQQKLTGYDVLVAFSVAGAATFGLMRLAFWWQNSKGIPQIFGRGIPKAMALGVMGGVTSAAIAFVYLKFMSCTPLLEQAHKTMLFGRQDILLLALLAVVAAPIFEEFIFRGLIFGGLRRSMGLLASVLASAAIFAIVHPPVSVVPVFGLGVATSLIYERTKQLIGPMTCHAVYNGLIVGFSIFFE